MTPKRIVLAVALAVLACTVTNSPTLAQDKTAQAATPFFFSAGIASDSTDGPTMKQQALATMKRVERSLKEAGFRSDDIVFVRAYLAPGQNGVVDYAGWEHASREFFNNTRSRPTRTVVAVPFLGPDRLIQVECIAMSKNSVLDGGMYWTAGMTAPLIKQDASPDENRADMLTQSRNALARLSDNLEEAGLTASDVVFVRAFIGPDKQGKFDFEGWNKAYDEFFKNESPSNRPPRSSVTSPAFAGRGALIEIEFVAKFPKTPAFFNTENSSKLHDFGEATAMISSGVGVKSGGALYFSGAAVPSVEGDMKAQSLSALESLRNRLAEKGAGFKDVIFLRAYVPSTDGKFDLNGWQEAYATFFNTSQQPHKSARTTITIQALPNPTWKIAIDAVAVVP